MAPAQGYLAKMMLELQICFKQAEVECLILNDIGSALFY